MQALAFRRARNLDSGLALLILLCLLIALASAISPAFLSLENLQNVIRAISVVGILAVGMTVVLIAGEVDLSVGSVAAFAGMVGALFVDQGGPAYLVVGATLAAGLFAGIVNGIGVALIGVPSLIMTLGTLAIARAVASLISHGQAAYPSDLDFYMAMGRGHILGMPVPILLFALIALAAFVMLRMTAIGRKLYAVGASPLAARMSGIRLSRVKLIAFAFVGFCAGLASVIQGARLGQIDPAMGQGYELTAIAIAILGGASLFGGRGSIEGTVLAAIIFGVLYNIFNLLGLSGHTQQVFVAMIIVAMAALHALRERTR